jgi:putative FmdB family regulatory protein
VALYEYRCGQDGPFDVMLPLGTAPATHACPECAGDSARVFSSPAMKTMNRELFRALEHEDKSRTNPEVVTSLPRKPKHQRTPVLPLTPTLAKLPRP